MATGSITTLGLGSGLELQNILDQLKDVDMAAIKAKETQKTQLEKKINAYNGVNAKLFTLKSDALSLCHDRRVDADVPEIQFFKNIGDCFR